MSSSPHFLEEVFDVFADDAKQTTFHTKSNMEATIAVFLAGRPWLAAERRAFVQSDGASNYKEPTTELDIPVIGTRLISVEGEGKGRCDADDANVKRGFIIAGIRGSRSRQLWSFVVWHQRWDCRATRSLFYTWMTPASKDESASQKSVNIRCGRLTKRVH